MATQTEGSGGKGIEGNPCGGRGPTMLMDRTRPLVIRVDNFADIRLAYGDQAADRATLHVQDLARTCLGCDLEPFGCQGGSFVAHVACPADPPRHATLAHKLQALADFSALEPLEVEGCAIHLALSIEPGPRDGENRKPSGAACVCALHPGCRQAGPEAIRMDMERVATLFAAIDTDNGGWLGGKGSTQFSLSWQPVRDVAAHGSVSRYMCHVHLVDARGVRLEMAPFRAAMERVGVVRLLDAHVMSRVFDELRGSTEIEICVRISPQSLASTFFMEELERQVRLNSDLAPRLLLEMPPGAEQMEIARMASALRDVRRRGVRLVLCDIGLGDLPLGSLALLNPDMVKIAPPALGIAACMNEGGSYYRHLVGLVRVFGAIVIADGIDTSEQQQLALEAGISQQQGHLHGAPSILRRWLAL